MRKNKMMRTASALLVATLLTTSVISGTFAKYTTTTSGNDTARVAYWGFDQTASINFDLFDDSYSNVAAQEINGAKDNVIAPGTTKESSFAFGYTDGKRNGDTAATITAPEVAYTLNVSVEATGDYDSLDDNESFTWSLKKTSGETTTTVGTYQTVAQLKAAIENLSGETDGSKDYAAGQLPTAFTNADETYTVGWNWAFDGQDVKDTKMGNAINHDSEDVTTLEHVALTITVSATQRD